MQWNELPTNIQRVLFERAASLSKEDQTLALREQIAASFTTTRTIRVRPVDTRFCALATLPSSLHACCWGSSGFLFRFLEGEDRA